MNSQPHEDIFVAQRLYVTLFKLDLYDGVNPLFIELDLAIKEMSEWLDMEARLHVP